MSAADHPPEPPDATFIRARWVYREHRAWAERCAQLLLNHGEVRGTTVYPKRDAAKKRARRLCELLDQLRLLDSWNLKRHTERKGNGWVWSVEFDRRHGAGAPPQHPSAHR